ncbi:MAG: undecaprenyl-diphosphatase UppP [Ardenticatenaceae bacterium]|nr:undecaprenyl-diphosphatase UppP [Ardenticatenaceae bacterium]
MSLIEAIIIGLIQGATEFLPISSSGHLILVPHLLKMSEPTLDVIAIVHLGTLVAVLIYFLRDILSIVTAVVEGVLYKRPFESPEARLGWYVVAGSIPVAIVGLALADYFESILATPLVASIMLLFTAILLIVGERLLTGKKGLAQMTWGDAMFIGLAQMLALMPGVSRSGSTITAGLMRGLDRTLAARYSFLLGIPPILGAGLLSIMDIINADNTMAQLPTLAAAFFAAAISGYACIHFLLTWLRQRSLYLFAIYCVAFSLFNLAVLWFGLI